MGNIITWIIAVPIIAAGVYILFKKVKGGMDGGSCSGCSGCDSPDKKKCHHDL